MISAPTMTRRPSDGDPWVETRAGGLFFVNALLASPPLIVAYAVGLRWLLRTAFGASGAILDPIPLVAAYVLPFVGWLAAPALGLVAWNLRIVDRRWAGVLLALFGLAHVATLGFTVRAWLG